MGTISLLEEIRPSSTKDLASVYGCCTKTMKRWINPYIVEVGEKNGRYYSVAQVKIIFDKLGLPCKVKH